MAKVTILFGTNLGNKKQNLLLAQQLVIQECGALISESSIYKTEAWGMENLPPEESVFYNKVICLETFFDPFVLLGKIQKIEYQMGRIKTYETIYMSRIIDIDILFFDHEVIDSKELTIPHPKLQFRKFVLMPLAEINPWFVHPVLSKKIETLLDECKDELLVEKINEQ